MRQHRMAGKNASNAVITARYIIYDEFQACFDSNLIDSLAYQIISDGKKLAWRYFATQPVHFTYRIAVSTTWIDDLTAASKTGNHVRYGLTDSYNIICLQYFLVDVAIKTQQPMPSNAGIWD